MSRRYTAGARFYDVLSGERWVYRAGRVAGLRLLNPARGGAVLDLGCGTGLNLPLLAEAVGPEGLVIGVDSSPSMLEVARRRIASSANIAVVEGDAVHLDVDGLRRMLQERGRRNAFDAVFASYAMSVFPDWRAAWSGALELLSPGARAGIVDMRPPDVVALRPLAALACAAGGADLRAAPWRGVQEDCIDVKTATLRSGHIVVTAGTYPGAP